MFTQYDRYALRWRGGINIAQAGKYMFQTNSDDGSMIYIDGKVVVVSTDQPPCVFCSAVSRRQFYTAPILLQDNDGLHGPQKKTGSVELTAGLHAIVITFFVRPWTLCRRFGAMWHTSRQLVVLIRSAHCRRKITAVPSWRCLGALRLAPL